MFDSLVCEITGVGFGGGMGGGGVFMYAIAEIVHVIIRWLAVSVIWFMYA
jgi:hypothetical protein